MTKEFYLKGLACAGCAGKIEDTVKSLEIVKEATINIATSKLQLVLDDATEENIHTTIEKIVHKFEPDVKVIDAALYSITETRVLDKSKMYWLIVCAVAFLCGILFEYFVDINGSRYISLFLFAFCYLGLGGKVLLRMLRNIANGRVFDENFLMGFATLGAIAIGYYYEAAIVMLFYQVGEFFQEMAVAKSKNRISDLMNIRPDYANLLKDGSTVRVSPEEVQIGDVFLVKPGEKIPLDGVVLEGEALLDTTALTGESVPRHVKENDHVLSGCINTNALLTIRATQTFGDSTVSKILDLVENAASKKAPTETFITKFARYYTPAVVIFAVLLAVTPPLLFGGDWIDWISRALIFLIISCPCALVLSIPMGFMGGIGGASKKGILIKGGNYLEALANLETVVFDKTGTLTEGVFKVTELRPSHGFSNDQLLKLAAHAEAYSNHPIASSIVTEYENATGTKVDKESISKQSETAGYGVVAELEGKTILAGNERHLKAAGIEFTPDGSGIGSNVYIAYDGQYVGYIVIADEIRADSYGLITKLKDLGVKKTYMLTGDVSNIADKVASELGIDETRAQLLPQQKVEEVERLNKAKHSKKTLAFVGDGINDAPVLAMADVGIAMGGLGSDAAIEAADVVLMTDEPAKLVEAVKIARFTKRVVWQNIVLSLGVKFVFLFLATVGVSSLWEAIFADVGVSLIAIVNSLRIMKES